MVVVNRHRIWTLALLLAGLLACSRSTPAESHDASAPPSVGFGTVMADIARRFELVGRALVAGRYELADYELGEISEQFDEELPHASLPKEGHPEVLPALVTDFTKTAVPDLQKGISTHDHDQSFAAFARMANKCNACHQASGHGFIEVPTVAGRSVPNTDPVGH
jgi:hypothetical protein